MKKYTHIFFDLDKTLWDFDNNSKAAMLITFNSFELNSTNVKFIDFFEKYSQNNQILWDRYRKKDIGKKELVRLRFQSTFKELGIAGIDPEEMNSFYLKEMPKQKILYPEVAELLKYLKSKRYKLFIITNGFKEVQHKKLENAGLSEYFNQVFTSEEIMTPKPGKEIFQHAIRSVNAKKGNSLMVGDDWEVDIIGAVGFGIDAVHFQPTSNNNQSIVEQKLKSNHVYQISHMKQLQSVL